METDQLSELRLLRQTVRSFVDEQLRPHEQAVEESDYLPPELMRSLRQEARKLGIYAYNVPERLGGGGLSLRQQTVVSEAAGRTTMALSEALGHLPESVLHASSRQSDWFLEPLVTGEKSLAYALTESDAGSDLSMLRTRATRRPERGDWVINGSKQFISHAATADFTIALAVTDADAQLPNRFTVFIVPRGAPGLHVDRTFSKMGWRGYQLAALSFSDCVVPDSHVLGEPGQGFPVMMSTINNARLGIAARCVGTAGLLLETACEYARARTTFGKLLAERENIQFALADIDVERHAAAALVERAACAGDDESHDYRVAVSRAKLYASEMVNRAADSVLQIFGGSGYMADLPIERIYRDVRAFRIGEGTSEMQRIQIARNLLWDRRG